MRGTGSRNAICLCGSGKRYKHCCGSSKSALPGGDDIPDTELLRALMAADDLHMAQGLEPSARSFLNVGKALESFGIHAVLMGFGSPAIVERTRELNDQLFTPKELRDGGMHLGAFLFRDMFCQLHAPIAFGECMIDFFKMVDLNDIQKAWLAETPDALACFVDQAADILDFGYGWTEFGHGRQIEARATDLIWRSHVQLEAAAATATSACDFRGTVQSALLGAELALKAGLAAHGVTDQELGSRAIGHNLSAAAERLGEFEPLLDVARIQRVASRMPNFVDSRYNSPPPGRVETGHILMGAQYIASEVTRRFSDRDCRADNASAVPRAYPV